MSKPDPADMELVAQARREHYGTVIEMPRGRSERHFVWRCHCGSGRDVSALVDWETAADELHAHENRAILTFLAPRLRPTGEYAEEGTEEDLSITAVIDLDNAKRPTAFVIRCPECGDVGRVPFTEWEEGAGMVGPKEQAIWYAHVAEKHAPAQ